MAYNPQTINSGDPITSAWGNKIEQELATVGNYLGRVATKGLLNNLSADYKDFAWVDDEQAFYWYAGNGWFPYDVKRLKEGFTLVNLLGSYGSFSKDSNGNGVADGWGGYGVTNVSLVDGVSGKAQQGSIVYSSGSPQFRRYMGLEPSHKYFVSWYVKSNRADGGCGMVTYYASKYNYLYMYPAQANVWQKLYSSFTTIFQDYTNANFTLFVAYSGKNPVANETYTSAWDNFCLYDLTWMDQYSPMPRSLQEKYSVSKWVDMTDDDLANELPYVDGVAYVGVGL